MTATISAGLDHRPTVNASLLLWVREVAELTIPDRVVWVDGSDEEWKRMITAPVDAGTFTRLAKKPNSFYGASDPMTWRASRNARSSVPPRNPARRPHQAPGGVCSYRRPLVRGGTSDDSFDRDPRRRRRAVAPRGVVLVRAGPPHAATVVRRRDGPRTVGVPLRPPGRSGPRPSPRTGDLAAGQEPADTSAGTTLRGRMRSVAGRGVAEPPSSPPRQRPPRSHTWTEVMIARPARSGRSMDLVPGQGAAPDAVTADPDLALARWENEGGVAASCPARNETPAPPL